MGASENAERVRRRIKATSSADVRARVLAAVAALTLGFAVAGCGDDEGGSASEQGESIGTAEEAVGESEASQGEAVGESEAEKGESIGKSEAEKGESIGKSYEDKYD